MTKLAELEARIVALEDELRDHKAKLAALGAPEGPPKPLNAYLTETTKHPESKTRIH